MATNKLTDLSSLVFVKGNATPVALPSAMPEVAAEPVVKKIAVVLAPAPIPEGGQSYWKALTLKLDRDRFLDLKSIGLLQNKTSQAVLIEALDLWIKKNKR